MIFGEPNVFAIQADVESLGKPKEYGYLTYWVSGAHIGYLDVDPDWLSSVRESFSVQLSRSPKDLSSAITGRPLHELLMLIYKSYYVDDESKIGPEFEQCILAPNGQPSLDGTFLVGVRNNDSWVVAGVCDGAMGRLRELRLEASDVASARIGLEDRAQILSSFIKWYDSEAT